MKIDMKMAKITDYLESVLREISSIKERQNMLFRKQDLIHSTLSGDMKWNHPDTPTSNAPSIMAWSPFPNSPPFPLMRPSKQVTYPRVSPQVDNPHVQQQHVEQKPSGGSVSYAESCHPESILDDVQSFLSENWDRPCHVQESIVPGGVQPAAVDNAITLNQAQSLPFTPLCSNSLPCLDTTPGPATHPAADEAKSVDNPLASLTPPNPFNLNAVQDIQLSELMQCITKERPSVDRGLSVTGGDPPSASHSTLATGDLPGVSQPSFTSMHSKHQAEYLAPDDFFSHCFLSTQLSPSSLVFTNFRSKLKGKEIDLTNVGRLGVLLARCSYFSDDILQSASLKGKGRGNRPGLDPQKLNSLFTDIHCQAFRNMTPEDFGAKIKPRIEQSLRDYLKPSRLMKNTCGSPQEPTDGT